MKKFLLLLTFSALSSSLLAQNFLWGKNGIPKDRGAVGEPYGDRSVAADNYGNAYVAGMFYDSLQFGAYTLKAKGIGMYFVKYDSNGNVTWARQTQASSASFAIPYGVATDIKGNVYITGYFGDTVSFGSLTLISGPYDKMFLVKYDPNGNVIWAKETTGGPAFGNTLAIDTLNDVYVLGTFTGSISFGSVNLNSSGIGTNTDIFLARYDTAGNTTWAEDATPGYPYSITVDNKGNTYIAGDYGASSIKFGSITLTNTSNFNMFLVRYDRTGNVRWAKDATLPSLTCSAYVSSVAVDASGGIYITGSFWDTATFGSQTFYKYNSNGFLLAKYDTSGSFIWAKTGSYVNNNSLFQGIGIACDTQKAGGGYALIGGTSPSKFYFNSDSITINKTYPSLTLILQFDSAGNILCNNYFSEGLEDDGDGFNVDASGRYIYVAGDYYDSTIIFGNDTLKEYYRQQELPYVARWQPCPNTLHGFINSQNARCNSLCNGEASITSFGGKAPYSYSWSNGNTSKADSGLCAGTYFVIVSDARGNRDTIKVNITQPPVLTTTVSKQNVICFGQSNGTATINPSGGTAPYTYNWSNSQTSQAAVGLSAGTYTATINDKNGCSIVDSVIIAQPAAINVSTSSVATYCPYDTGSASASASGGTGTFTYSWNNGSTNSSINGLSAGTYTVTVTDSNGCTKTASATIAVIGIPVDSACCNTSITNGQSITLDVSPNTAGNSYIWSPSTSLSCDNCPDPVATPSVSTLYVVTIINSKGCRVEDSVLVGVSQDCEIFVPNAFSPNGDGQNDILYVKGPCIQTMNFVIFDRWGNKVFESESESVGWDGTCHGQPMNTGTYVYRLAAVRYDGSVVNTKGSIALVR